MPTAKLKQFYGSEMSSCTKFWRFQLFKKKEKKCSKEWIHLFDNFIMQIAEYTVWGFIKTYTT